MLKTVVNNPFLKDLPQEQFNLLAPLFMPFAAFQNTVIFEQGDRAEYLYLILGGTVSIQYKPYDGPKILITHLHAGDVFGWSSVIGEATYTSSVVSTGPLDAVRIRGAELRDLCLKHPEAGCAILEKLAEVVSPRWKNAKDQIKEMLQNKIK